VTADVGPLIPPTPPDISGVCVNALKSDSGNSFVDGVRLRWRILVTDLPFAFSCLADGQLG
jgi:hypothetical protein